MDVLQDDAGRAAVVTLPLSRDAVPRDPAQSGSGVSANAIPGISGSAQPAPTVVAFDRFELRDLLNLYGRMVAAGEWRDYAMDFTADLAVFSVFRRAHDLPFYRVEKNPKLARKQGQYVLRGSAGQVLKRGHELPLVLRVLDKPVKLVVG